MRACVLLTLRGPRATGGCQSVSVLPRGDLRHTAYLSLSIIKKVAVLYRRGSGSEGPEEGEAAGKQARRGHAGAGNVIMYEPNTILVHTT